MSEPSESRAFDVIVIGAGPTGENVADRTAAAGLRTAIVESELVGGDCSYWACIPSKALLRPPAALEAARAVAGARHAAGGQLDVAAVLARRDGFVSDWQDDGQVAWLESAGIELIRGHGRLAGERRVTVAAPDGGTVDLTATHAVAVCTGSAAVVPGLPGVAEARPWTPREATGARKAPDRLAIVGGGVVGAEMAAAWSALGSKVTLLMRGERPLPRMEPFAGDLVADGLAARGVDVRPGASVAELRRAHATGPVTLTLEGGETLEADEVLFATGRKPRTEDMGLETVGIEPGAWLDVDETLRVRGVDGGWLYCAGDTNRRALLTHQGKYQARVAGAAIVARAAGGPIDDGPWGEHAATADTVGAPQVVFTEPEAASVGLTAQEAERAGRRVRAVDYDLGNVAGASLFSDDYRGRARIVVDLDREVLVGATFVGPQAGDLLHAATIAVTAEVPIARLWHAVPCFPTVSEIWLRLLETLRG
ncbi:dihydrolipoyl dehydrogenase family protein [Streptomyces radicis]|uniref:NAD(P)/FAD-dependent oxidoreductase n=1 Tax=Streptomyces radicis TaxID=1750517 RepID=A0A3A9VX95_9ACTN|nr:NAD(P)/FAD-dependent oxidoreductase [Streptomyces radicis]RKN05389.1 NAD(P)/FAD-dependent oxidoreductase [Streptomyces radicis]RKN16897.1 NAD(P)/FAD-dependent oxidoreductase [Streptomyces radicis]